MLVQWENLTEASWEDLAEFQASYPHFNLEDKVGFNGGGNVTNKPNKEGPVGVAEVETLN